MDRVLRLYRTPLRDGESAYTIGGIDQGIYADGVHVGEKRPKLLSLKPSILEDGRMLWEMLDSPENREYCANLLPQSENPPFTYMMGDDAVTLFDSNDEIQDDEAEPTNQKNKPRGRPFTSKSVKG